MDKRAVEAVLVLIGLAGLSVTALYSPSRAFMTALLASVAFYYVGAIDSDW